MSEELEEKYDDGGTDLANRRRGSRAEEVAQWYFRLNGFMSIPGFVVHPDAPMPVPRTEADLLAIRLKCSREGVWRRDHGGQVRVAYKPTDMEDDPILLNAGRVKTVPRHLVAMVEVKTGICKINGPWSDQVKYGGGDAASNMERALARVGFGNHTEVTTAAEAMYRKLRYEGKEFVVQYFAIGLQKSDELAALYPALVQVSFDQIGSFLWRRFCAFPEKLPQRADVILWDGFGDRFRWWFEGGGSYNRKTAGELGCQQFVRRYIEGTAD
jgi:hypothetical protein